MNKVFLRNTSLLTLFFFLWFTIGSGLAYAVDKENQVIKAENFLQMKQNSRAIKVLKTFIKSNENNNNLRSEIAKSYFLLAKIYFSLDADDPEIREYLKKVLQYDKDFNTDELSEEFNSVFEQVKAESLNNRSENEAVSGESAPVNVIEQPGQKKKKKKFPWLLVVGGAVVVGVILFLVLKKKKKYDLTVTVGEGVTGTPAAGTYSHKKGETVNYNYSLQTGYTDLTVLVDGQSASASGTITMDANHSITVSATEVAFINVNSTPQEAQIFMDNTDTGFLTNHTFSFTTGGAHSFILRKLGYLQYQTSVTAVLGQTRTVDKTLEKGLHEDFNSGADSLVFWQWQPRTSEQWDISNGKYIIGAKVKEWLYSVYDYDWSETRYTVTVKMTRSAGQTYASNSVILANSNNPLQVYGYLFNYTTGGWVSVWKEKGINLKNSSVGSETAILKWIKKPAVNRRLGSWNTFKIVRDGSNYTYYLNDQKIKAFNDSSFDARYIIIAGYCGTGAYVEYVKLEFDYVYFEPGNTTGSIAGLPVSNIKIKGVEKGHSGSHE